MGVDLTKKGAAQAGGCDIWFGHYSVIRRNNI